MKEARKQYTKLMQRFRPEVWNKTNGHCWYCGCETNPWSTFTIDHMIPYSAGGPTSLDNLVPCCNGCNLMKANLSVKEFRKVFIDCHGKSVFYFEEMKLFIKPHQY